MDHAFQQTESNGNIKTAITFIPGFFFFFGDTVAKQVLVRGQKIQAVKASENLSVIEGGTAEVEEDVAAVDRRKIQHRDGGGARGVEAGENLAIVFKARRDGGRGELRWTTVNVVVYSFGRGEASIVVAAAATVGDFLGKRNRDLVWLPRRTRHAFHG